ncbi:unnamed protein product [Pleuronectes platessa]|uniref:PDZ domain-containing protein n=1 Tax=Pleuronectes platessa TaxID=8262 RepID=A0A9N7V5V0_PLEPL|nr:unnamed protein product [Pleuronectes platessa]
MRQSKSQCLRPRLCALEKGDNGYGFHLHGEKGKTGQFIRLVESDSPAETSGLRAGDRLVFVNGEDVETESHQQVVSMKRRRKRREEVEEVRVEVDGTVGEEKREKAEEKEVVVMVEEQQQQQQQEEEEEEEEVTPRESTRTNGDIHEHVEKKLSINSEKRIAAMCHGPLWKLVPHDADAARLRPGEAMRLNIKSAALTWLHNRHREKHVLCVCERITGHEGLSSPEHLCPLAAASWMFTPEAVSVRG